MQAVTHPHSIAKKVAPKNSCDELIDYAVKAHFEPRQLANPGLATEVLVGSLKQAFVRNLSVTDRDKITGILDSDPRLNLNGRIILPPRGHVDAEAIERVVDQYAIKNELSPQAHTALQMLGRAYVPYLSAFTTEGETEPLSSLWGYLIDREMQWDMYLALDKNNQPLAGVSGQVITLDEFAAKPGGKIAWRENVWVTPQAREQGMGRMIALEFNTRVAEMGAIFCFGEVENPYKLKHFPLNPSQEPLYNRADPEALKRAWREEGEQISPFARLKFHQGNGHIMACIKGEDGLLRPVPYAQISMDRATLQEYVSSLNIFLTPLGAEGAALTGSVSARDIARLYRATQETITEHYAEHPEYHRIQSTLKQLGDQKIVFLKPNSEEGIAAMARFRGREDAITLGSDIRFALDRFREYQRKGDTAGQMRMSDHVLIAFGGLYEILEHNGHAKNFSSALGLLRDAGVSKRLRNSIREVIQFRKTALNVAQD